MQARPFLVDPTVETNLHGDLTVIEALVAGDSRDRRALEAVRRLREREAPAALANTRAVVLLTGETAEELDYPALMKTWLPRIFVFVLGLSFVLLTLAFRSVVVAAKAIALNLLSVGAADGAGRARVPEGHRQRAARPAPDGADHHLVAIGSAARVITGAALIIIAVFAGFAAGDLVETQQIGFGVGVALLIDATLVRSVLVPASMQLLGHWNWYLPRWLQWLPDVQIERCHTR